MRCGLRARQLTYVTLYTERFGLLRLLHTPIATGRNESCRVGHPATREKRAFPRRTAILAHPIRVGHIPGTRQTRRVASSVRSRPSPACDRRLLSGGPKSTAS
jgi:hypothetical protein